MTIESLLEIIIGYSNLYVQTGKPEHYAKVTNAKSEVIKLSKLPLDTDEIKVAKFNKGRPSVIEWNNERWIYDPQTTFKGGNQRGNQVQKTIEQSPNGNIS